MGLDLMQLPPPPHPQPALLAFSPVLPSQFTLRCPLQVLHMVEPDLGFPDPEPSAGVQMSKAWAGACRPVPVSCSGNWLHQAARKEEGSFQRHIGPLLVTLTSATARSARLQDRYPPNCWQLFTRGSRALLSAPPSACGLSSWGPRKWAETSQTHAIYTTDLAERRSNADSHLEVEPGGGL